MQLFIGFGYNDDDKWIRELVFPLAEAFEFEVVLGEITQGAILSEAVKKRITESDAMLGFLTRRDPMQNGNFTSHRWVYEEINTAINGKVTTLEIREAKVDNQGGAAGNREHLEFDLDDKAQLLVKLAQHLSAWRRQLKPRRLFLQPRDIVQDARPHLSKGKLTCTYSFKTGSKDSAEWEAKPFNLGMGLCVDIRNVPSEDSLVRIKISGPDFLWESDYESVQLLSIQLQKI